MSSPMDPRMFALFGAAVVCVLAVGIYAVAVTRNLIRVLIGMEVITKAVTLLLIAAGQRANRLALAQSLTITLIIVEVAVIVVAVSLVLCVHRTAKSVDTSAVQEIEG